MARLSKILLSVSVYSLAPFAYADDYNISTNNFLYIGGEYGVVEPVVKKFRHQHSGSDLVLKRSKMYSVKLGYSYYPQMAIEFSATYQPKYRLNYTLPETATIMGAIPKTKGTTKVSSNVYMINLIYDLNKVKELTPFVILGGGLAQVKFRPTISVWNSPVGPIDYFRVKKQRHNCLAWQVGLGFSKDITSNFSIDVAAKLQAVSNIKIKYDTLDISTGLFNRAKPIKKTIGVGEFGIGFTYKLPI
ncbi:MAG: outer membrane beta-barrel protein [Rickettsia endosymbiont of Bryobia graminum]|nr:outer membrane beta-barrel protein [Rickettsia endosymbiont of Bryobia graminum]